MLNRFVRTFALCALVCSFSLNLEAQSLPAITDDIYSETDSVVMEYVGKEVVVEGFKQNKNLKTMPVSASELSSGILEERNIVNLKEISSVVPNLFIHEYGSKKISPVYIRGIGSHKDMPSVGLYVDGVPYFDRTTFDLDISEVENIEVLRGPQGTVYGRNTMGGIINIQTKSPFKYQGTDLGLGMGNYDNYEARLSHYGNVKQKFGYAGSVKYNHQGGYFKNITKNKKADPLDEVAGRIRLEWKATDKLTLGLTSNYEYLDQDGYPYSEYNIETKELASISYNRDSYFRRNTSTSGFNVKYLGDGYKLSSQSSFQYYDGLQGLDQDFTAADVAYTKFYQRQQMYSQEVNIQSQNTSKYQWQFGVFGFYQNYKQQSDVDYYGKKAGRITDAHNPTTGFALYHQSSLNDLFIPNLTLSAGIRYDWEKTKSVTDTTNIDGTKNEFVKGNWKKNIFSEITPKVSLQYTINNHGMIYSSISRGYKTGGFNNVTKRDEPKTYDSEHSWCYEIGYKADLLKGLVSYDLALFYIDWENQQVSQTRAEGAPLVTNAGKSASKGVEFNTQINPFKNFSIQLSYGYTHAKFKDYKKSETVVYNDNFLPMVPRNTFSAGANYKWNVNNILVDNIIFNAQYVGVGKLYWNDANSVDQPFYGVINGRVAFERKNVSFDFWMKNIGSEDYLTYYFSSDPKSYGQRSKPFSCGVNISCKF